ncbi:MAG: hypothetical protein H6855_03400 [Rhodospirillales bacterium]|nr:hypothetical protein [Rhodospirillales bacterium]MCB9973584.1 hypothetical protein [Rhodospirillales bacterium]MCB9979612.1 hypothetical protein [Rhodospirillales bacterium]
MRKLFFLLKRSRTLGVSDTHTYDIPLDKGSGHLFLISLIGLMVFLAFLSVSAAIILSQFSRQWQTGLEGHWTIELPAVDSKGNLIPRDKLEQKAEKITESLKSFKPLRDVKILPQEEIIKLLEPWFQVQNATGDALDLPFPLLISLTTDSAPPSLATELQTQITRIMPEARLDTHEEWLRQLLKLTGTLHLTAFLFTVVICSAGVVALAGAMQSRMAEHKDNIELLHLIGAEDSYITRQFQRHAIIMALQGAAAGLSAAAIFLYGLRLYLHGQSDLLLPVFEMNALFWLKLSLIPFLTILLCGLTTRFTVLRTLHRML